MALKKKEKLLLSVLIIIGSYYVIDTFVLSDDKKGVTKKGKKIERVEKNLPNKLKDAKADFEKFFNPDIRRVLIEQEMDPKLLSQWQRDPFLGAFTSDILDSMQQKDPDFFVLKGISWRGNIATVIINDEIYKKGETKNGVRVLSVYKDKVEMSFEGKKTTLKLGEINDNQNN